MKLLALGLLGIAAVAVIVSVVSAVNPLVSFVPIASMGGVTIGLDPNQNEDALTRKAACLDTILQCASASGQTGDGFYAARNACVSRVPSCASADEGGEGCCPSSCIGLYQERVQQGADPSRAYEQIFLSGADCFPGLVDWLSGKE